MKRVLYSGIFDLFHCGHLGAFKEARKFGDYLIIHVASDKEVKCVKGDLRPIIPGKERVDLIKSCRYVDEVFYSDEYMTDEEVIRETGADVMIRNEGSTDKYDIEIGYIPRCVPESRLDTTEIIKKIQGTENQAPLAGINYVLIVGDEILLQRRDKVSDILNPGKLAIPGGGVEPGENPHMAAVRELEEETGLVLHPSKFEFLCDFKYPWGDVNRFYVVRLNQKPEIKQLEGRFVWFRTKEINEPLAGNQDLILNIL